MSFFKRLLGITETNYGEILTKVGERTWVSSSGETINQVNEDVSISSNGTVYTKTGSTVVGSDGSLYTSLGDSMSSDGSIRQGHTATGRGAIFTDDQDDC